MIPTSPDVPLATITQSAELPLVVSLVGTFLKPEMQSVYRQITGLRLHRTIVFTERRSHPEAFPFEPVVQMEKADAAPRAPRFARGPKPPKPARRRPRGNFLRRFYYKHVLGVWPPPAKGAPVVAAPPFAHSPAASPANSASSPLTVSIEAERPDLYNLRPLLESHRPSLLHIYYGHKAVKFLPMLRHWPGRVVVSFHGLDAADAAYPRFSGGAAEALPAVFAHAALVLARSQSLLDRLAALGCPPAKLRLNRAGIPLDGLPRSLRCPPPGGRWRLLQACRLIEKKGLATTLRAFREVQRVWPEARLTLAGDGPQAHDLRAFAAELGVADQVHFTGWCAQDRLRELYREAHIFLHPSEHTAAGDREGVPNSLLEAMATGLPAVATVHGGIPEAVRAGHDGLLVPEKDAGALAEAVLRLTHDAGLLGAISAQAPISVAERFDAERQVAALERCYAEVINEGAHRSDH